LVVAIDSSGDETVFGSGVIIDADGLIATNLHVVEDAARIRFRLSSGPVKEAVLLHKHSEHDLAILYTNERNLPAARLGDSDKIEVGQDVVAIGNPKGLENTISPGIISGIRTLRGLRFLQTTAPISGGSSGGPLLNLKGEVIGLTVFTVRDSQNLNFAIPVNEVRAALRAAKSQLKLVMEELAKAKAEEEAARRRAAEEERRRKAAELEASKRAEAEEARRQVLEAEAAKKRAAEMAATPKEGGEAARRKAGELGVARAVVAEEVRRRAARLPSLLPVPDLPLTVVPLPLEVTRPLFEPPGPPPAPAPLTLQLEPERGEYVTYRLAETVERQGSLPEAERYYRVLRETGKVELIAQRAANRLGLLLLRGQRPLEARAEGEALLRAGVLPELREGVLLLTAEAAARSGDANRAGILFRRALREYPTSAQAGRMRLLLGWALLADGEMKPALREWQEAGLVTDVEVAVLAQRAIANVGLRQGQDADSLAALRALATLAPRDPLSDTFALDRGILLIRARDYATAVQELEPLVPRITDGIRQPVLRRALGIARYRLDQFEAAERQFNWATTLAPAEPSNWLALGLAALAQDHLNEAEKALSTARLAAALDVAIPASYGLVLVSARRGDEVGFHERASGFMDRYPTHPLSARLANVLRRRQDSPPGQ
jgi:Flp pilus assembly protein TadD